MRYALVALLLLAGCETPAQRAQNDINEYGPYCDALGYQRDSDGWRQCIQLQKGVDFPPPTRVRRY